MTKIAYISKSFQKSSEKIILAANDIINEYMSDGLVLTLRQLYYQFVSRNLIANKQSEYKRLGSIINDARLAGFIDWEAIEDRTRNLNKNSHWENPGDIIKTAERSFMVDRWAGQLYRPEVWIEKEALAGVIAGICERLDVPYFACKGYVSQSEMWGAAMRLQDKGYSEISKPVIIHLGDHDPSGVDMTRDIVDRMEMFGAWVEVQRIALNYDQIEEYSPPPNPAKVTDSRATGYIEEYGHNSWELDALDPKTLRDLIEKTVRSYRDDNQYNTVLEKETEYRNILSDFSKNWAANQ